MNTDRPMPLGAMYYDPNDNNVYSMSPNAWMRPRYWLQWLIWIVTLGWRRKDPCQVDPTRREVGGHVLGRDGWYFHHGHEKFGPYYTEAHALMARDTYRRNV